MKRLPSDLNTIQPYITASIRMLKTHGLMSFTFNGMNTKGVWVIQGEFANNEEKNLFYDNIRLFGIKESITEYVVISEAWGVKQDAKEPPSGQVSEHPNKQEFLSAVHVKRINEELHCAAYFLPIIRDNSGTFLELGKNILDDDEGTFGGSLANLISKHTPTPKAIREAEVIHSLGISKGYIYPMTTRFISNNEMRH